MSFPREQTNAHIRRLNAAERAKQADPTCEYMTRDDAGKNVECGAPALYQGVKGARLFYCATHGEFIRRHIEIATLDGKSLGKPLNLFQRR